MSSGDSEDSDDTYGQHATGEDQAIPSEPAHGNTGGVSSHARYKGVEWRRDAPRLRHVGQSDGDHIIATGCGCGKNLYYAVVVDLLRSAGIPVQQASRRNNSWLERKLRQMYELLEKGEKDRWGRLNGKRKKDGRQQVPYMEVQKLMERVQLEKDLPPLIKHFAL